MSDLVTSSQQAVSDALTVARRNLLKVRRVPDILVFTTITPIMFILLFAYVFGGAIDPSGGGAAYREFLIAGIFAQTVVFGATFTGYGIAEDVQKGIIDRFRTLPMAPSAVLAGRTLSDVLNNVITLVVMSLTGLLVGWRIRSSFLDAVLGYLTLLVFAYAISWIMAWIGLLVPVPDVVNNASFVVVFPMTFIANTFVPISTLPSALRVFAEWNPVSTVTQVARERFGNTAGLDPSEVTSWALRNPEIYTVIWAVLVMAVFVPLASAQYRRATSR